MQTVIHRAGKSKTRLKVFDEEILNDPWIFFHGTSSCNEALIDAQGLSSTHSWVARDEITEIASIYKSMNWLDSHGFGSLSAWSLPFLSEGGKDIREIYLTCSAGTAADYSGKDVAGGECVEMVLRCIARLRSYLQKREVRLEHIQTQLEQYETPEYYPSPAVIHVNLRWLRDLLTAIKPLYQGLKSLRQKHKYGVVYAVRFREEDVPFFTCCGRTCTYVGNIEPSRFVAKAKIMGRGCNFDTVPWRDLKITTCSEGLESKWNSWQKLQPKKVSVAKLDDFWNSLERDPAAGVDLARKFDVAGLQHFIASRYPELSADHVTTACDAT
jgi:hypothetical protein